MRLHRFYTDQKLEPGRETMIMDEATLHQWKKVFRLKAEDSIILFNGSGKEYPSRIITLGKKEGIVYIAEEKNISYSAKRELWLFCALIKKDNFEWIVEKGTELGVTHFVPLLTDRSEKKDLNMERLQKIATEATEQSGRGSLPEIHPVIELEEAMKKYLVPSIALEPKGEKLNLEKFDFPQLALYLGPEGGWSDRELEIFQKNKIPVLSFGTQILRAETAAIAISSLFSFVIASKSILF